MRSKQQGIGLALLLLALSVTFELLSSTCAAPMNFQNYSTVHLKGVKEGEVPKQVTNNRTSETSGGGWTVIQKRMDGSVDFNRTWDDYKYGFGTFSGEFWLGLDKINRLTRNKTKNKLRVDLGVETGKTAHAEYDWFAIGNEMVKYQLYIGNKTNETATFDSFGPHRNQVFGTWDRYPHDCDEKRGGGWWYSDSNCAVWSNLNGLYFDNKTSCAIYWSNLSTVPEESIPRSVEMKIRPVDFFSSFSRYTD